MCTSTLGKNDFNAGRLVKYGGRLFEVKHADIKTKNKRSTVFLKLFDMMKHRLVECQISEAQCSEFTNVESFEKILVEYDSEDPDCGLAFFSDSRYNRYEVPLNLVEKIEYTHRTPGRPMVLYVDNKICLSVSTVV